MTDLEAAARLRENIGTYHAERGFVFDASLTVALHMGAAALEQRHALENVSLDDPSKPLSFDDPRLIRFRWFIDGAWKVLRPSELAAHAERLERELEQARAALREVQDAAANIRKIL